MRRIVNADELRESTPEETLVEYQLRVTRLLAATTRLSFDFHRKVYMTKFEDDRSMLAEQALISILGTDYRSELDRIFEALPPDPSLDFLDQMMADYHAGRYDDEWEEA